MRVKTVLFAAAASMMMFAGAASAQNYGYGCPMDEVCRGFENYYAGQPEFQYNTPQEQYYNTQRPIGVIYEVETYKVEYVPRVSRIKQGETAVYCNQGYCSQQ